jgi:hypothetical protein
VAAYLPWVFSKPLSAPRIFEDLICLSSPSQLKDGDQAGQGARELGAVAVGAGGGQLPADGDGAGIYDSVPSRIRESMRVRADSDRPRCRGESRIDQRMLKGRCLSLGARGQLARLI